MKKLTLALLLLLPVIVKGQITPPAPITSQTQSIWYVNQHDFAISLVYSNAVLTSIAANQLIFGVGTQAIQSTPYATLDNIGNLAATTLTAGVAGFKMGIQGYNGVELSISSAFQSNANFCLRQDASAVTTLNGSALRFSQGGTQVGYFDTDGTLHLAYALYAPNGVTTAIANGQLLYGTGTQSIGSSANALLDANGNLTVNSITATTYNNLPGGGGSGNVSTSGFNSTYQIPFTMSGSSLGSSANATLDAIGNMVIGSLSVGGNCIILGNGTIVSGYNVIGVGLVGGNAKIMNMSSNAVFGYADGGTGVIAMPAVTQTAGGVTTISGTSSGGNPGIHFTFGGADVGKFLANNYLSLPYGLTLGSSNNATIDPNGNVVCNSITASTYYGLPGGGGGIGGSVATGQLPYGYASNTLNSSANALLDGSGNLTVNSITATTYNGLPGGSGNVTGTFTTGQLPYATDTHALSSSSNARVDASGNAVFLGTLSAGTTSVSGLTSTTSIEMLNGFDIDHGMASMDPNGNLTATTLTAGVAGFKMGIQGYNGVELSISSAFQSNANFCLRQDASAVTTLNGSALRFSQGGTQVGYFDTDGTFHLAYALYAPNGVIGVGLVGGNAKIMNMSSNAVFGYADGGTGVIAMPAVTQTAGGVTTISGTSSGGNPGIHFTFGGADVGKFLANDYLSLPYGLTLGSSNNATIDPNGNLTASSVNATTYYNLPASLPAQVNAIRQTNLGTSISGSLTSAASASVYRVSYDMGYWSGTPDATGSVTLTITWTVNGSGKSFTGSALNFGAASRDQNGVITCLPDAGTAIGYSASWSSGVNGDHYYCGLILEKLN